MVGAQFLQPSLHDIKSKLRPITFTADMAKVQMLQLCRYDLLRKISRGLVGKMSVAA